jgi:hypothetical protein
MKKNILFLVSGIAAGVVLCLFAALHLPVRKDDETDWPVFF